MGEKSSEGAKPKLNLDQEGSEGNTSVALEQLRNSKKKKNQTKIDFIQELLKSRLLESNHKEKLLNLVSNELRLVEFDTQTTKKEVEIIKKKLREISDAIGGSTDEKSSSNEGISRVKVNNSTQLQKYRDPKITSDFLREMNQNIILKSTTHLVDENLLNDINKKLNTKIYSYDIHSEAIEKEFNKLRREFFISKNLYGKIEEFLLKKDGGGWSAGNIKQGWRSSEIVKWCKRNPGKCPNPDKDLGYAGLQLDEPIPLSDGTILSSFNDVISHFKMGIEFRDDSDIKKIVSRSNKSYFKNEEFDLSGMNEGIRFYTDVEKVTQAYKKIIEMCEKAHKSKDGVDEKPKFKIYLHEKEQGKVIFGITHLNSVFNKTESSLINRYGKDFSGLISNQLNGLCDFFLKSEFPNNKQAKISIWPQNEEFEYPKDVNYEGVTFELIFYRTK